MSHGLPIPFQANRLRRLNRNSDEFGIRGNCCEAVNIERAK